MRFDVGTTTNKSGMAGRNRLRLWMLVGSLGIVLAAMNQLRKDETIERLDQLFGVSDTSLSDASLSNDRAEKISGRIDSPSDGAVRDDSSLEATKPVSAIRTTQATTENDQAATDDIEDNTYFRPEEREAWFEVFRKLEKTPPDQLIAESLGEVAYAQFVNQPEEYRHQIVTVSGNVVREELQRPGPNALDIEEYHRLWVSPKGGGQWPIVVFCRELPDEFPRGDHLNVNVSIPGSFFKNWSYSYDEGLGLAPVVLANSFEWSKPPANTAIKQLPVVQLLWAATAAGVLSLGVVWLAVRRTMRPASAYSELPKHLAEGNLPTKDPSGDSHE